MTVGKVVVFLFLVIFFALLVANRPKREPPPDIEALNAAQRKRQRKRNRPGGMAGSIRTDVTVTIFLACLSVAALATIEPLGASNKTVLEVHEWTCTRYAVPSLATEPVCIQLTRKEHV